MISVIIPTYKKTPMLVTNLQKNMPSLYDTQIIVVNDDPTASIKNELVSFPVTLIENEKNLGFGAAVDRGIMQANNEYCMLLNSDVVLMDTSFVRAQAQLEHDQTVFAVTFAQREKDSRIVGKNIIRFENGFLSHTSASDLGAGPSAWAEGGSCMMRKSYYKLLGGFDTLYTPFYWEDIDLSYRAWKSGYRILFDPDILVEHHHESTIGSLFSQLDIQRIAFRNQCICTWKNMDRTYITKHVIHVPKLLAKNLTNITLLSGYVDAMKRLPIVITKRSAQRRYFKLTDDQIFAIVGT